MKTFLSYHLITEGPGKIGAGTALIYYVTSIIGIPPNVHNTLGSLPLVNKLDAAHIDVIIKALLAGLLAMALFAYKRKHVTTTVASTPQVVNKA